MQNATKLRGLVAVIDDHLTTIARFLEGELPAPALAELQAAWSSLKGALALGPEPAVRVCPSCGHTVMRAAARCGYCWSSLQPLPEIPNVVEVRGGKPRA